MNTHETYVSLETARLLKQAGFDWKCRTYWVEADKSKETASVLPAKPILYSGLHPLSTRNYYETIFLDWNNFKGEFEFYYSAPTLAITQRWLREVKRKHIEASPENDEYTEWLFCIYNSDSIAYTGYKTYEEAIEAGIKKALEIILEKGE